MHFQHIVVDNFLNNAEATRAYVLTLPFEVVGNYPGRRSVSFATTELRDALESIVSPLSGRIVDFPMDPSGYNGAFQYTTSRDQSWVHVDGHNNWAGVLFLTPDAPVSAGTGFFKPRFPDTDLSRDSQDMTKWELVDRVGNVFNRLVLFRGHVPHRSLDYFGTDVQSGRLFQVFFFSTER